MCIKLVSHNNTSLSVFVCGAITVNIIYYISSKKHTTTLLCQYLSAVQLLSKTQYTLYKSSFTQKHFTVCTSLRYNYCQYQNILCIKPVTNNTSLSDSVSSTITVNMKIYCVSIQLNPTTHYCLYCSAVELQSVSQFSLFPVSYPKQHIIVSTKLQYNYSQYHTIPCIRPVTNINTSLTVPVCNTFNVNIAI
jgi:hypothetical protein